MEMKINQNGGEDADEDECSISRLVHFILISFFSVSMQNLTYIPYLPVLPS